MGTWWRDAGWDWGTSCGLTRATTSISRSFYASFTSFPPTPCRACRALGGLSWLITTHWEWGASLGGRQGLWMWWVSACPLTLMWFFAGLARLPWRAGTPGRCLCVPHVPVPHHLSTQLGAPGRECLVFESMGVTLLPGCVLGPLQLSRTCQACLTWCLQEPLALSGSALPGDTPCSHWGKPISAVIPFLPPFRAIRETQDPQDLR